MKKLVYLLSCIFLLTAALAACSSSDLYDNPPEQPNSHQDEVPAGDSKSANGIHNPVNPNEDLVSFMKKALPWNSFSNSFFEDGFSDGLSESSCVCVIIHNHDEFSEMYHGEEQLPKVDFEKYSLVIGRQLLEQYGYSLVKQQIVSDKNGLTLSLDFQLGEGYHEQAFMFYNYWGLYPKLDESTISVKVTKHYNY